MKKPLNYKTLLSFLLCCVCTFNLFAQDWEQTFIHNFGWGKGFDVVEAADGGFVMVGDIDYPTGAIRHYAWLVKTDEAGNELWSHVYNAGAVGQQTGRAVLETTDGGFIIAGSTSSDLSFSGGMIMRTDTNGDSLWTKIHAYNGAEVFHAIAETDAGYIAVGDATEIPNGNNQALWIVGLDEVGDSLWTKKYFTDLGSINSGMDIIKAEDGNFLITGLRKDSILVAKITEQGDMLWSNTYAVAVTESGLSIAEKANGEILIGAYTTGFAWLLPVLLTLDENGSLLNTTSPGAGMPGVVSDIALSPDGGHVIVGSIYDFWTNISGDTSGYVIKYNAQGTVDWEIELDKDTNIQASGIKATSDGGYIISGGGNEGMFLKKIDGGLNAVKENKDQLPIADIYPNPATEKIIIELPEDLLAQNLSLDIFDSEGHLIKRQKINEGTTVIETAYLPFGFYETVIYSDKELLQANKVIVAN